MKKTRQKTIFTLWLLLAISFVFLTSCDKDDTTPTEPTIDYGEVAGIVSEPGRTPLAGVTVGIGSKSTTTDSEGRFYLSHIATGARILVNFAKTDYISCQKVVQVQKGLTSYVTSTLFLPSTQTFNPTQENMLYETYNIVGVPANSLVDSNGNLFTGTARAEIKFFDPSQSDHLNAFPGTFYGIMSDGTETMFESYGFFSATFTDNENSQNILQLDQGKQSFVRLLIPYSMQDGAPSTIPLWFYDTSDGRWKEQGSATRNGNYYEGYINHFSFWNFDYPIDLTDQASIAGRVIMDDGAQTPASGAQVVAMGVNYNGYTTATAGIDGMFRISVKAMAQVKLQAFLGTNSSPISAAITTPAAGVIYPFGDIVVGDLSFRLLGKIIDLDGNPISNSYGLIYRVNPPPNVDDFSAWVSTDANGKFNFSQTYPYQGESINVQFSFSAQSTQMFSASLPLIVPNPGGIKDFGDVSLVPGGLVTGLVKYSDGTHPTEGWITFMQQGNTGEANHFGSQIDETGRFIIQGPANTSLTNMKALYYYGQTSYTSNLFTINFPASNATTDIGTITLIPAK